MHLDSDRGRPPQDSVQSQFGAAQSPSQAFPTIQSTPAFSQLLGLAAGGWVHLPLTPPHRVGYHGYGGRVDDLINAATGLPRQLMPGDAMPCQCLLAAASTRPNALTPRIPSIHQQQQALSRMASGGDNGPNGPEQHLLSLLHDGDRCLAEARLSLRRAARLQEALHEEGGWVDAVMFPRFLTPLGLS